MLAAKVKAGELDYKDISTIITTEAADRVLTEHGIVKGMTDAKRTGTYKRPEYFTEQFMKDQYEI